MGNQPHRLKRLDRTNYLMTGGNRAIGVYHAMVVVILAAEYHIHYWQFYDF